MADDSKEQHSKERTKAEAQFKQAQKPKASPAGVYSIVLYQLGTLLPPKPQGNVPTQKVKT